MSLSFAGALRTSTAACALLAGLAAPALADDAATDLPDVVIKEKPTIAERFQLPNTTESVTADKIGRTINAVDTEDAVKYMPSIFVRKRNMGDTQPVMATRTWGVGSSARSMVYADDVLISALFANNNSQGAPRWGMVTPEEIERIDIMYGPFSAAYPGNSMGAVMQITTKMPEKFETSAKQTEAVQTFSNWGTHDNYRTSQTNASMGSKHGDFAWLVSAGHQNSFAQPISDITNGTIPTGTRGAFAATNRFGANAPVLGAGALLHTEQDNLKVKLAYDVTPVIKATYTFGLWTNSANAHVETYLKDAAGNPTFGNIAGFASGTYWLDQLHTSHSLALKSDTKGNLDFDLAATHYQMDQDTQSTPTGVTATGANFASTGYLAKLNGTNWTTLDAKGIWRPEGKDGEHELSFGGHYDRYILVNPTYRISNWISASGVTGTYSDGRGQTQTTAGWVQDVWRLQPGLKATLGGRYEYWNAFSGYNLATNGISTVQPSMDASAFSPKASMAWEFVPQWTVTGSVGKGTRFPTVTELYQTISLGATQSNPSGSLRPERFRTEEIAIEGQIPDGKVRLSLFQEDVQKAMISQSSSLNGTTTSYIQNIDAIRNRGWELAAQKNHVLIEGLEFSGSVTYVDSEILRNPTWRSSTSPTQSVGKHAPNIPDWRVTLAATYRPIEEWAMSAAMRYSGTQYSTLDNTDTYHNVYQSFDSFLVVDLRTQYKLNDNFEAAFGIDNVNNCKYYLFHPFPQRTFIGELKVKW
ncbi:Outer membrane receptor protein [Candidatus Terasakiella magnetica]|nr:Outer membrane receptor protein [Candidatus Terasakiella magnetica]